MIKSTVSIAIVFLLLLLFTLTIYQESLIYPGMKRPSQILKKPFEQIDNSFYKKGSTGKIWVFFGGNGALPIDCIDYMKLIKPDHSFLIITYPGYNGVKEKLTPKSINNTIDRCIQQIKDRGYKPSDINFMCYSLGCAIAINWLFDTKFEINKLVLLAPFWSLDEIVNSKYPFPKFVIKKLMNHNWENEKLENINQKIDVTIFHGKQDKLIDCSHSERLSKIKIGSKLIFTEDDHQSIRNVISITINETIL